MASNTAALARIDERVGAVHEYIINEIRPAIKELAGLKETVSWLKAGVIGVYGLLGSVLLSAVVYAFKM